MNKPASLREAMPNTAAFIDFARELVGVEAINAEIKKGMAGMPGHFHAKEAGHEAGTPFPPVPTTRGGWVSLAQIDVAPPVPTKKGRS